jgi:hypothetical protein
MDRPNAELAVWVADRMERVIWLTPADGEAFSLEPAVARRLLAYAGFSLYRDAQSLGMPAAGGVPSLARWPRAAPVTTTICFAA